MLELLQRLDFWLTVLALGFFVMLEIDKVRAWRRRRTGGHTVTHSQSGGPPVMSRPITGHSPVPRIAREVDEPLTAGQSGIAVNRQPAVNDADEESVNEERDISDVEEQEKALRYRERLRTLADLIDAGVLHQAEGIEAAFHCTRSGRKDSKYAQARADLLPLLKSKEAQPPAIAPYSQRPIPSGVVFHSDDPSLQYQEPTG